MKTTTINNIKLNYAGNIDLLKEPCISVSGSRKIDKRSASWLKNKLRNCKAPIISGLALGTDTIAHKFALQKNIPTIAILPCGIGNITPKQNTELAKEILQNGGLLLSEYDYKTPANRSRYIARNKLIAYFGSFLIVPQFDYKSGTRHTVDFAKDFNKTIYVKKDGFSGNQFIIHNNNYKTKVI